MNASDFAFFADMLRRRSGLLLTADKIPLIDGKLVPIARRFGFKEVSSLFAELRHGSEELARAATEAMTTNETSFFRDFSPFQRFRDKMLPALREVRAETRRIRIWCTAASTGQEPYSLAMILDDEKLLADGWKIDLIATDLSSDAIARAAGGIYSQFEAQRGLSPAHLAKHFQQEGDQWRIADRLRRMVDFRVFNLLDSFGWLGEIDVVFCRNVLFYFDQRSKARVLDKLEDTLALDGYLVLGAAESTHGLSSAFSAVEDMRGLYVKPRTVPARQAAAG